ncbi:hypothetical protein DFJ77DRAFT_479173 [Powellomyces hirtus]|nr:hypothetical protein DFJ77DRAFT_479173 [Powellomyces hirtus]
MDSKPKTCPISNGTLPVYRIAWGVDVPFGTKPTAIPFEVNTTASSVCECADQCHAASSPRCDYFTFSYPSTCHLRTLALPQLNYSTIFAQVPDHVLVGDLPRPDPIDHIKHVPGTPNVSALECVTACQAIVGCFYVNWNGTDCWLKSASPGVSGGEVATGMKSWTGVFVELSPPPAPPPRTIIPPEMSEGAGLRNRTAWIVGGVLGVIGCFAIIFCVFFFWKRKKSEPGTNISLPRDSHPLSIDEIFTPALTLSLSHRTPTPYPATPHLPSPSPSPAFRPLSLPRLSIPRYASPHSPYPPSPSQSSPTYSPQTPTLPSPTSSASTHLLDPKHLPPPVYSPTDTNTTTTTSTYPQFSIYHAIREHTSPEPDQLPVVPGDAVLVQEYLDSGDCLAVNATRGGKGYVPLEYLSPGTCKR